MTDVFVRVWADSLLRLGMAVAVVERLLMRRDLHVVLLIAENSIEHPSFKATPSFSVPRTNFHVESKRFAEQFAQTDPYIVIDDDQLMLGSTFLQLWLKTQQEFDVGLLSSWSVNGEVPAPPEGFVPYGWWPCESVGTPYLVRKGLLVDLPDGPLSQYDGILTRHLNDHGHTTGFARHVRHNHLGMGFSQVIPGWWQV